jgi:hypothetical protein
MSDTGKKWTQPITSVLKWTGNLLADALIKMAPPPVRGVLTRYSCELADPSYKWNMSYTFYTLTIYDREFYLAGWSSSQAGGTVLKVDDMIESIAKILAHEVDLSLEECHLGRITSDDLMEFRKELVCLRDPIQRE